MKKIVSMVLFAGCIFGFVACQKEALDPGAETPSGKQVQMIIKAKQSDTKTVLNGTTVKWKEGDKVTVMYEKVSESGWFTQESGSASSDDSYATASFSVTLTSPNTSKNAYAIYPANNLTQSEASKAKIPIAATQHPTATSFDGASDILISKPFTPAGVVTTQFSRPGAVLKIKIKNATLSSESERLLRLTVTGENDLVGDVLVNLSDTEPSVDGIENGNHTVTAEYASGLGLDNYVYLVVSPQTLDEGSHLIIHGTTENYSFSKDITLSQDIHLNAGHIIPLNIDITSIHRMPTGNTGWYRVEDAAWLFAGDRVAIVASGSDYALSTTQNDNNRGSASVTKGVDSPYATVSFGSDVQVFVLETGTVYGSFSFWNDNGSNPNQYIYAASSSSNWMRTKDVVDANASFSISVEDGKASITAQGDKSHNIVRYYSSLFSCYSSGSANVSIYKYYGSGSTPICEAPVISLDNSEVTITAGSGTTVYYTTDGSNPTKESTQYTSSFSIVSATTVKAIATRDHYNNSSIAREDLAPTCATPVISAHGSYFTITCATEGASIYYETSTTSPGDVTTPTTSSTPYTTDVSTTATTYVKAFAVKDGCSDSSVASATVTYSAPKTYTFTISTSDFNGTSYAANNNEKTTTATAADDSTIDVYWTSYQVYKSAGSMTWKSGEGYIYNSTNLGTITSLTINSTDGSFTTYYGDSVQPSSNTTPGGHFFKINTGSSKNGKTDSIVVQFTK